MMWARQWQKKKNSDSSDNKIVNQDKSSHDVFGLIKRGKFGVWWRVKVYV